MFVHGKTLRALGLLSAFAMFGSASAWAQATDLVCTGCVGTSDITGGAVTSGKIGNGEVKTPDLAADAVTSPRIKDGQVKTPDLANEAVTTGKLAVGAVRGGRLANGAVTTNKIGTGAVTADKLAPDAVFGRILVVRGVPGDQAGNCDELRATLADITDNDSANRYLIHLEPGIYDCGATSVEMKPFVDIQGSGENMTSIKGTHDLAEAAVILGNADAILSHVNVENVGSPTLGSVGIAIKTNGGDLRHVTATASGAVAENTAVESGTAAKLSHVTARATGSGEIPDSVAYGIKIIAPGNDRTNPITLDNVTTAASGALKDVGLRVEGGPTVIVNSSFLEGDDRAFNGANSGGVQTYFALAGTGVRETFGGGFICIASAYRLSFAGGFANFVPQCILSAEF